MKKHIIFDNYNYKEKDYEEGFKEFCEINELDPENEDIQDFINGQLLEWWDDEFEYNLNFNLDNETIIVIADLGFWYGRRSGYKILDTKNVGEAIASIFSDDEDYREIYVDDGDVKGAGYHHDGVHHYTWRLLKKTVKKADLEELKNRIYNNEEYADLLEKCTKSLAPVITKVYGWSDK